MGVLDLGYPLWLLISVLIVFAVLLYYMLRGRVSERLRAPLALVLAPVCTVAAVAVAVILSALLSPLYEAPTDPMEPQPSLLLTTPRTPRPTHIPGPTASPTSS